jgi:hypothetical protein
MRIRTLLPIGLLLALAAFAPNAGGAATIGASSSGTPTSVPGSCAVAVNFTPVSCTMYISSIVNSAETAPNGLTAPADGVITRWRIQTGPSPTTSLVVTPRVLRFTAFFRAIASGTPRSLPASGGSFAFDDRLPVEKYDQLAVDSLANGPVGAGPAAVATIATNASLVAKTPAIADGATFPVMIVIGPPTQTKLMISADVEADVDRDGYGDETQDGCIPRADVHSTCPAPIVGGPSLAARGLSLTVDRAARALTTLDRVSAGRMRGGKCRRGTSRGKRCSIFKRFAQWGDDLAAGANTISWAYKVGGRNLRRGGYRARIVVTNPEGLSVERTIRFRIR